MLHVSVLRTPNGIRTRATAVKGRRPRPLDDGGLIRISPGYSSTSFVGSFDSLGYGCPNLQTRWSQHQFRSSCTLSSRAPIAQLVELRTFNPQVVGSSPTGGTSSLAVVASVAGGDSADAGRHVRECDDRQPRKSHQAHRHQTASDRSCGATASVWQRRVCEPLQRLRYWSRPARP